MTNIFSEGMAWAETGAGVLDLAWETGHLFAGGLAANLAFLTDELRPGRFGLLVNFGGFFSATCVVVHATGDGSGG